MRCDNIAILDKSKGKRSDCNNYRGVSVLGIVGKLFTCVVMKRLQVLAERVHAESLKEQEVNSAH